jgi:hypothetical protein
MSDIVERLRMGLATPIELEAADEIERLRRSYENMAENATVKSIEIERQDAEIERLRAHIAELEAWQQEGQKLFDNYAVGLGTMFGLGKWWGDRPWKQPPFCASCGKHKEYCDGC